FHSSQPTSASHAEKNSIPLALGVSCEIRDGNARSVIVPIAVPSLVMSELPPLPSATTKKSLLPTATSCAGLEPMGPDLMSSTSEVPAAVPSLFQSSRPDTPSSAVKKSTPPTSRNPDGLEPA